MCLGLFRDLVKGRQTMTGELRVCYATNYDYIYRYVCLHFVSEVSRNQRNKQIGRGGTKSCTENAS